MERACMPSCVRACVVFLCDVAGQTSVVLLLLL
jgi:hypothetical protein